MGGSKRVVHRYVHKEIRQIGIRKAIMWLIVLFGSGTVLQTGCTITYWGVESIETAYARLIKLGTSENTPITEVGDNIKTATIKDPAGNVIGLIENPHFQVR